MKMRRRWLIVSTSCVSSAMQRLLKTMPSNTDLQAALNATTIAIVVEGRQHWPHDLIGDHLSWTDVILTWNVPSVERVML
jgi:hypothetical protein